MIELFECGPMMAKISRKQCEHNRKQCDDHSGGRMADARCKGCAGLGAAIIINPEGIMAAKCKVVGCTKAVQKQGMCKAHLNGSEPRKSVFKSPRVADASDTGKVAVMADAARVIAHIEQAARVQVPEIVLCDECGNEPCLCVAAEPMFTLDVQEITNIDYIAFLRQKAEERFEAAVSRLNKTRTPEEHARVYLVELSAYTGIGY